MAYIETKITSKQKSEVFQTRSTLPTTMKEELMWHPIERMRAQVKRVAQTGRAAVEKNFRCGCRERRQPSAGVLYEISTVTGEDARNGTTMCGVQPPRLNV